MFFSRKTGAVFFVMAWLGLLFFNAGQSGCARELVASDEPAQPTPDTDPPDGDAPPDPHSPDNDGDFEILSIEIHPYMQAILMNSNGIPLGTVGNVEVRLDVRNSNGQADTFYCDSTEDGTVMDCGTLTYMDIATDEKITITATVLESAPDGTAAPAEPDVESITLKSIDNFNGHYQNPYLWNPLLQPTMVKSSLTRLASDRY